MVQDFSKNREVYFQDEIKSAHWSKLQIAMHPSVCWYRYSLDSPPERIVLTHLSDNVAHTAHMVQYITEHTIELIKAKYPELKYVEIFSDGCISQYKGKVAWSHLKNMPLVTRNYFCSEHGKADSDLETGLLNQSVNLAILSRQAVITNAVDLFNYCNSFLQTESRRYHLILDNHLAPIIDHFDVSTCGTLPGTRKVHQIMSAASIVAPTRKSKDTVLLVRPYACFCENCLIYKFEECKYQQHTGGGFVEVWQKKGKYQPQWESSKTSEKDTLNSEEPEGELMQPQTLTKEPITTPLPVLIAAGDFVIVKQETQKGRTLRYLATVCNASVACDDGVERVEVRYLKQQSGTTFTMSDFKNDVDKLVLKSEIILKMPIPSVDMRQRYVFPGEISVDG